MIALGAYRKAIVLAAVAVGSAGAAWTAQGWRMGKQLAEQKAAHTAANVRRQAVALDAWHKAAIDAGQAAWEARETLRRERLANSVALKRLREQQPLNPEYACRMLPLPESYLEVFRK